MIIVQSWGLYCEMPDSGFKYELSASPAREVCTKNRSPTFHCIDLTSVVNKLFITWLIINIPHYPKKAFSSVTYVYQQKKSLGNVLHFIHFILACQCMEIPLVVQDFISMMHSPGIVDLLGHYLCIYGFFTIIFTTNNLQLIYNLPC